MKSYSYDIDSKISGCGQEGMSKADARKRIKERYYEETGIELVDAEITNIVEEKDD